MTRWLLMLKCMFMLFNILLYSQINILLWTKFIFTDTGLQIYGGPGSLTHDFKIWPITFQGSGPSGPILFSFEKSHFNEKYSSYRESTNSTKQKVHVGSQYSKTCLKQPLKKDKTKILIANGSLMQVKSIAECSLWSILRYFWPALRDNWSFIVAA